MNEQEKAIFKQIQNVLCQPSNYVPRTYETVGGRWTVDTYKKGEITAWIMDEGWTIKIFSSEFDATDSGGYYKIEKGTLTDLEDALNLLLNPIDPLIYTNGELEGEGIL